MNWYNKFSAKHSLEETANVVKGFLNLLHYAEPDVNLNKLSYDDILTLIFKHNFHELHKDYTPERLASITMFYLKNKDYQSAPYVMPSQDTNEYWNTQHYQIDDIESVIQ